MINPVPTVYSAGVDAMAAHLPPWPPTDPLLEAAARAVLDPSWAKLYVPGGSNDAEPGVVTLEQALASGRPFFGRTLPHVWAIDVDEPDHEAYSLLLTVLELAGLEFLEVDSGGHVRPGRHVFVHAPQKHVRKNVRDWVEGEHPGVIDWRMQEGGSPIRPPFGLHRNGRTRSAPLVDPAEALQMLQRWYGEHYRRPARALPAWAEALRRNDQETFDRLRPGRRLRRPDGSLDRSAVDVSLALAYLNAGLTETDFLQDRLPGGRFPSPKAEQVRDPVAYLGRQWADAASRPEPHGRGRIGLDRLDEFEVLVHESPVLKRTPRQVLLTLIAEARRLGKLILSIDQRTLAELAGLTRTTAARALDQLIKAELIERVSLEPLPTDGVPAGTRRLPEGRRATTYRLRVLEVLSDELVQSGSIPSCTGGDRTVWPPIAPSHPLFFNRSGLGLTGYQTLIAFGGEPKTKAEASRNARDVSQRTFKSKTKELEELGLIVPEAPGSRRYMVAPDLATRIERVARELGLFEVEAARKRRNDNDRLRQIEWLWQRGKLSMEEAQEQIEAVHRRRRDLSVLDRSPIDHHGVLVDPVTGEVLGAFADRDEPAVVPPDSGPVSSSSGDPYPSSTNPPASCAACGGPTVTREPNTGLPWHLDVCLVPPWIVQYYEVQAVIIPSHLRADVPVIVDRWGDDWSDVADPAFSDRQLAAASSGGFAREAVAA